MSRSHPLTLVAVAILACCPAALLAQQAPAPVVVVEPRRANLTEALQLSGTLTAERSAALSPRVDGLVLRLRVDAGDRVKAGQVLLEQDAAVARLSLQRAKAATAQAAAVRAEAQRLVTEAKPLVQDGLIPATEFARRESAVVLAAAALDAARAAEREQSEQVRRHQLVAPFAGVIARRLIDLGEWATRGTPVLELVATDRLRLDVQAPQERFVRVAPDAPVEVRSALLPDIKFAGRIDARVPVGGTTSRTFLIRILVDDAASRLLPGTSATAVISLPSTGSAMIVPRDALLRYPDGSYSVFVLEDSDGKQVAREQKVQIGAGGTEVEVTAGLSVGQRVVVRGNELLRTGREVRVVDGG
ncbi:MAG: efflux RND transporter periplasmic adaptor subunit [Proteobacteria bacterium]|nr:efflux RND transporter periplasmic adaptor subunit [Pseudomonadota bacterium]